LPAKLKPCGENDGASTDREDEAVGCAGAGRYLILHMCEETCGTTGLSRFSREFMVAAGLRAGTVVDLSAVGISFGKQVMTKSIVVCACWNEAQNRRDGDI
jgi:hypothetical protein